jgi:DegV family protein with EDD domain
MQIVTDSGMDLYLPVEEMPEQEIHIIRHTITLDGKTYRSGLDISSEELYRKLVETGKFPITSQPSAGEFAEVFRRLAAKDPDILCINMSSGLSGTVNAATAAVEMVPEARVTIIDSKTLSGPLGWQVAAAARAIKAGWAKDKIIALLKKIADASDAIYTLNDLKYLIHGGRIGHMKGLVASLLRIKPLIGVTKDTGIYEQLGQTRTIENAIKGLVAIMTRKHKPGTALRVQVIHALNPEGASMLRNLIDQTFQCTWLPVGYMSPVLGAHTGPSMVGVGYAALADYPVLP